MQLLINIEEIHVTRQAYERDLPRDWLDAQLRAEPPTGFRARGAAHLLAHLTRVGRGALVEGSFVAPLKGECRRCLKAVELSHAVSFTRSFVPRVELPGARAVREAPPDDEGPSGSFADSEVDDEPFEGESFDLAPTVREALLLESPAQPLCREDCRGLCPVCGVDRNNEDCGHDTRVPDPRWAALKNVKV